MQECIVELIKSTIVFKFNLPHHDAGIKKIAISTVNDICYEVLGAEEFAKVIYNSIVGYAYNEFEMHDNEQCALIAALRNKLKYRHSADPEVKLKYGFFGEVVLFSMLFVLHNAKPLIARGYFYNPLENSETKGYDSYHLVQNGAQTELWFGEVKFYIDYKSAIDSVMSNIGKAISDEYLENNILEIHNKKNNFNIVGSKIDAVIRKWEENPEIRIIDEIRDNDLKLVYPILILFEGDSSKYNETILSVERYINKEYPALVSNISIPYSLFFMLMPISKVKETKMKVLEWIESKTPLMS